MQIISIQIDNFHGYAMLNYQRVRATICFDFDHLKQDQLRVLGQALNLRFGGVPQRGGYPGISVTS